MYGTKRRFVDNGMLFLHNGGLFLDKAGLFNIKKCSMDILALEKKIFRENTPTPTYAMVNLL